MKKKVWNVSVLDNPNRAVMGENDEFYTTDTEAFLVFELADANFKPKNALLTLINRNDKSVVSEVVNVVDGVIKYELREEVIAHYGNWQAQLVYRQPKDGITESYTSQPIQFVVEGHIASGQLPPPPLEIIESWELFMLHAQDFLDGYDGRLTNVENNKADQSDVDEVTTQLAQKVSKGEVSVLDIDKNKGKLDQTYMTDDFIQQIAGTTPVNAIPADESITKNKLANGAVSFAGMNRKIFEKVKTYEVYDKFTGDDLMVDFVFDLRDAKANNAITIDDKLSVSFGFFTDDENVDSIGVKVWFNNAPNAMDIWGADRDITYNSPNPMIDTSVNDFTEYATVKGNLPTTNYDFAHVMITVKLKDRSKSVRFFVNNVLLSIGSYSFVNYNENIETISAGGNPDKYINLSDSFSRAVLNYADFSKLDKRISVLDEHTDERLSNLEDKSLPSFTSTRWADKEYLSIGDSVTWYDGHVLNGTDGVVCVGYQQQIVNRLGVEYTNVGVSGMSMVKSPTHTSSFMNQMTTIDFSMYDLATINLGTNDFWLHGGATIGELGNKSDTSFDETTFYGAYRKAVEYILRTNPRIKLVLMTPTNLNATDPTPNGFTLAQYVKAIEDIGEMYGLPVVNLYKNSSFNKITFNTYTIDGVHPSNAGHYEMGNYTAGVLSTL